MVIFFRYVKGNFEENPWTSFFGLTRFLKIVTIASVKVLERSRVIEVLPLYTRVDTTLFFGCLVSCPRIGCRCADRDSATEYAVAYLLGGRCEPQ